MSVCINQNNFNKQHFLQNISMDDQASKCIPTTTKKWRLSKQIKIWLNRSRQRKILSTLDDRLLLDIGYTSARATKECNKPFWK